MSKENQSVSARVRSICGEQHEGTGNQVGVSFKGLQVHATSCLAAASAILRMYWRDPECEAGCFREGTKADGSDRPAPMDANAIEGVANLVHQASDALLGVLCLPGAIAADVHPVRAALVPAVDLIEPARFDAAVLTPALAFALGSLLDQAAERFDALVLPVATLPEAA